MLYKGQRVNTVLGTGVILGFEYIAHNKILILDEDNDYTSRFILKLDDPSRWACASDKTPNPYMMRYDLID